MRDPDKRRIPQAIWDATKTACGGPPPGVSVLAGRGCTTHLPSERREPMCGTCGKPCFIGPDGQRWCPTHGPQ